METRVTEVADGVHQLTTHIPEIDFGFNQYLLAAEEPLLFHTGMRGVFPLVSGAIGRVLPPDTLRWGSFGHVEADECGAMNDLLALAPHATVAQGGIGCMVSIGDLADRPPRPLADGEVLDVGGHRLRWLDTPHVPHGWEAGVLFDETTGTLLCGDLFSQVGAPAALTTGDVVEPAMAAERMFHASTMAPHTGAVLRGLGDLEPSTLAIMHGASFSGDGSRALYDLATAYESLLLDA